MIDRPYVQFKISNFESNVIEVAELFKPNISQNNVRKLMMHM